MNGPISIVLALMLAIAPGGAARRMTPADVDALPATTPTLVEKYGSDALEFGELRLPPGKGPFPVAVVIHGGCWTKGFATLRNTAPIASALLGKGIATWNIEYRQIGDAGGGWPGSFQDWGAATDYLRVLAKRYPLDLKRVVAVGHSAGAHGALWVSARHRLPATSVIRGRNPLRLSAAVAIDGPGDLAPFVGADARICGQPVISNLLGGTLAEQPQRYREATPFDQLPLGTRQYLVSSTVLTPAAAAVYRQAAIAKGDAAEVLGDIPGADHFNIIAPGEPQWAAVEAVVLKAFAKP